MADIDAHAIETIVEPGADEQAEMAKTEAALDEAIEQDTQAE